MLMSRFSMCMFCRSAIHKSAKRKAAEALLAARFATFPTFNTALSDVLEVSKVQRLYSQSSPASSVTASPHAEREARHIAACGSTCQSGRVTGWCHFEVRCCCYPAGTMMVAPYGA